MMMNYSFVPTLLSIFVWICVCVCEFHTVEVQPGEEVTLQCSNLSAFLSHVFWFKLTNKPSASCISSMFNSESNVTICEGFQQDRFNMTSNNTNIFLNIKQVDFPDSGLYVCGVRTMGHPTVFTATYLQFKEVTEEFSSLVVVILGGVVLVLLMIIICLVIKIRTIHTGQKSPLHQIENLNYDSLNYAALSFHSKAQSSRRPVAETELETNVVYAAAR